MVIKLLSFLLFFAFCLGQFGRVQFGQGIALTFLDVIVGVFFLFFFFQTVLRKEFGEVLQGQLFKPFVIFFVICCISLLLNPLSLLFHEILISALYLARLALYFGLFLFIKQSTAKEKHILLTSLIAGGFVTLVIGFMQYFYYPNLRNLFYLGWDDHLYRLFSVFLDPNFAGVMFSLFFFLLLGKFLEKKKRDFSRRVFLVVPSVFTVIAIFLTYSRTGMITLLVGTISLLFLRGNKKMLLVCLLFFTAVLLVTSDVKVEGLNPFRKASTSARLESMRTAIAIWQKHPILGVGFNTYRYAQHTYGYRVGGVWESSHADAGTDNSFLFVIATTGVVGFLSFAYLWFRILTFCWKKVERAKTGFPAVVFSSLVALLASSFFLNTLFYPFVLLWVIILFAAMERN